MFPTGNTSGLAQRAKGNKTKLDTKSPPAVMVKPETPCKLFTVRLIAVPYNKQANKAERIANHPDDPKLSPGLPKNKTRGSKTARPLKTRISIKKIGPNTGLVNRRNKNEEPQMAERKINSEISRKLTLFINFQNF